MDKFQPVKMYMSRDELIVFVLYHNQIYVINPERRINDPATVKQLAALVQYVLGVNEATASTRTPNVADLDATIENLMVDTTGHLAGRILRTLYPTASAPSYIPCGWPSGGWLVEYDLAQHGELPAGD